MSTNGKNNTKLSKYLPNWKIKNYKDRLTNKKIIKKIIIWATVNNLMILNVHI